MARHPFDFLSAALGVVAVGLGVLVSTASIDRVDTDLGWWFALAALVLGLGLIPWNRRRSTDDGSGAHPLGSVRHTDIPRRHRRTIRQHDGHRHR